MATLSVSDIGALLTAESGFVCSLSWRATNLKVVSPICTLLPRTPPYPWGHGLVAFATQNPGLAFVELRSSDAKWNLCPS